MISMKMYSLYRSLCILTLIMNVGVHVVSVGIGVELLLLGLFLLLAAFCGLQEYMLLLYRSHSMLLSLY